MNETFYTITSEGKLPAGEDTLQLRMDYKPTGKDSAHVTLFVNGKPVGSGDAKETVPRTYSLSETFDIAEDTITSVSPGIYKSPFRFNGNLNKVIVRLQGSATLNN